MKDKLNRKVCSFNLRAVLLTMMLTLFCGLLSAQAQTKQITGTVTDEAGQPLPGVTVMVEGTTSGTITDLDGKYQISVPNGAKLVFSFIGYENVTMVATNNLKVTMSENTKEIDEVVVVGYGQQKKASVVGAITQANAEVLQRTTGVSDLGTALTGNLPGLVTIQSTGMPGSENPSMIIRGSSSWNGSDPLVLVDGIERPMSSVDIASVESISVLKDASATAIYGVKGANGVVIITTKRGKEGRAQINVSGSTTLKVVSKLPGKLDSYDALMATNRAIEHELNLNPDSWKDMNSQEFINNYRYRDANATDEFGNLLTERYPNVDWQDYLFKNYATAQTANISVMGGSKVVRYFSSVDYAHEGDLFKDFENARGYKSGYNYNRVNVRSNLDFNITKYTVLKTNLAGSAAIQRTPWSNSGYSSMSDWQLSQQWAGAYNIAPDVFLPRYADGSWGANLDPVTSGYSNATNSAANVGLGGNQRKTTTNIATDLILEQDLKFITEGLSFTGMVSWDNRFEETERGINDLFHSPRHKSIDPKTGIVYYDPADNKEKSNEFDYTDPIAWTTGNGHLNNWATFRRFNYQFRLNYDKTIGKHNFTVMGLFERQENTSGSDIPARRENWAFRVTYNWNSKYFAEYNGAYNGSEKFSEDNRFAFFNSGAIGWTISQESFMDNLRESGIINNLKLRMSYGEIGDDNVYKRWLYASTWALGTAYGGSQSSAMMREKPRGGDGVSPYQFYRENTVGNPDVHWEVVRKFNVGLDYGFLNDMFRGSVEYFRDKRTDILVNGDQRAIPAYFGQDAPTANLGEVKSHGFEVELKFNKDIKAVKGLNVWANLNMNHAENEIIVKDDPEFYPSYRKQAGYAIGQTRSFIDGGFMQTYDDVYASPAYDAQEENKIPGDYYIVDFNGDGVINNDDSAPVYYSGTPQNSYNATLGVNYKGWSVFAQFYGVNNVTRDVPLGSFGNNRMHNVYDNGTWWADDHEGAEMRTPRWNTQSGVYDGLQYLYDGSYLRLKNLEIAYTFPKLTLGRYNFKDVKIYVSGNNLWVYTKMPDDRESNLTGGGSTGQYPTVKRFTLGLKFSL